MGGIPRAAVAAGEVVLSFSNWICWNYWWVSPAVGLLECKKLQLFNWLTWILTGKLQSVNRDLLWLQFVAFKSKSSLSQSKCNLLSESVCIYFFNYYKCSCFWNTALFCCLKYFTDQTVALESVFSSSSLKASVWSAEIYLLADEVCVCGGGFPVIDGTKALQHPIKVQHQICSSWMTS